MKLRSLLVLSLLAATARAAEPPALSLPDLAGRTATLSEYRGRTPVLVVFYRGHW